MKVEDLTVQAKFAWFEAVIIVAKPEELRYTIRTPRGTTIKSVIADVDGPQQNARFHIWSFGDINTEMVDKNVDIVPVGCCFTPTEGQDVEHVATSSFAMEINGKRIIQLFAFLQEVTRAN